MNTGKWTARELKLLGRVPDSVLARRLGRTIKAVVAEREFRRVALVTPSRRWTAREIRLLGTMPDLEVARRLRRNPSSIRYQRAALQIPVFKSRAPARVWTK